MKKITKLSIMVLALLVLSAAVFGCSKSNNDSKVSEGKKAGNEKKLLENKLLLRMGHVLTENEPTQTAAMQFAKRVNERTNGEIEVKIFPNSTLGSDPDLTEQAKLGNPVIGETNPTYLVDMAPDLGIIGGPFLVNGWDDLKKIVESDFMKEQEGILQKKGLRVLAFNWYFGERHLITNKKSVKSPSDLKGVKIRSAQSPMWLETIKAMGAVPAPLAWSEVYTGIEQHVIDGAEAPMSTIYASKLHEVAKNLSKTGHFSQVNGWMMSEKLFSSLPKEYQNVLLEEAVLAGELMTKETIKRNNEFEQKLKDSGVDIVEPDIKAFQKATEVVYSNLSKTWSPGLYDRIQKILGK